MIILGILVGASILIGMVYLSISKRSAPGIRFAALIALGLMVLTVIVCLCFSILGAKIQADESVPVISLDKQPAPKNTGSIIFLVIFIAFLLGMFIMVTIISLKEQREHKKNAVKQKTAALFLDDGEEL
jgi:ABC-type Fe3+ transport system permease subunit